MDKVLLLADPQSHAWNFAEKIQKYLQKKRKYFVPLEKVNISHFGNNEIDMSIPKNVRRKDVYFIHDSNKDPQEWWVQILLFKDLALSSSIENLTFVLPDLLYSRQDRKHESRVPISARAVAESISPGLKKIITMDLHAPQIQGVYPSNVPLDNLYSFPEISRYLIKAQKNNLENLIGVSPDKGGVERVIAFMNRLAVYDKGNSVHNLYSTAFLYKRRVKAGKVEEMRLNGNVEGKNCLLIDDIIDSGGTLIEASKILRKNGAKKLFCYATHGLFTKGIEKLSENFELIMTSNTHYVEYPTVKIIDVTPLFAEAICRAQKGESISILFE